jgi:hypothetical protein
VRAYVGHGRLDRLEHLHILRQLCSALWLYQNFLQSLMRTQQKPAWANSTIGESSTPTPPFERLCEIEALPRKVLSRLQTLRRQTNPIQLRQQIAALIEQLWAVPVCPAR